MSEPTVFEDEELRNTIVDLLIEYKSADKKGRLSVYMRLLGLIHSRDQNKRGYDINRLGSWVFIGDNANLNNLDDLYWSYVMEYVSRDSADYDHYTLDYVKNNMRYAGFDKVGIHKMLARANQYAKERINDLTKEKNNVQ